VSQQVRTGGKGSIPFGELRLLRMGSPWVILNRRTTLVRIEEGEDTISRAFIHPSA
jgi:hypothetical protein